MSDATWSVGGSAATAILLVNIAPNADPPIKTCRRVAKEFMRRLV
jgi:hypothetical protein